MNLINDAKQALKFHVDLHLDTPLLLRSGLTGDVTDSAIERTPEVDGQPAKLHISGYAWASLLRRTMSRIDVVKAMELGSYHRDETGKPRKNEQGVSPLWCEATFAELHATSVNPGNAIDRQWGAAKPGALYNDELVIAGLPLTLEFTLFANTSEDAKTWETLMLQSLKLIDDGIENLGGGWTYGFGRLKVEAIKSVTLDLTKTEDRTHLWRWETDQWGANSGRTLPASVAASAPATIISVTARVAPGQLMAVKSSVFPIAAPKSAKLPDSFVFRRNRMVEGKLAQEPVVTGKAIRQTLLSVPLERKWRTLRKAGEPEICLTTTRGKPQPKDKRCHCKRCRWFGSTDAAGIVAVTDAQVTDFATEVVNRVQLCEHSMMVMPKKLFSGEYLTRGKFSFKIIIDDSRAADSSDLVKEIIGVLDEMTDESSREEHPSFFNKTDMQPPAPPGWYRLGGTSTCTGQVLVLSYKIAGGVTS